VPNPFRFFVASSYYTLISGLSIAGVQKIAHNVPAVYDVFAGRIRALRSKDQPCKTVGGVSRGNGAKRNDLGERNPEPL
jgi:hypothetical protein